MIDIHTIDEPSVGIVNCSRLLHVEGMNRNYLSAGNYLRVGHFRFKFKCNYYKKRTKKHKDFSILLNSKSIVSPHLLLPLLLSKWLNSYICAGIISCFNKDISMGVIGVIFGLVGLYVFAMLSGFHEVKEGYVGIYKKLGVLQKTLTEPGFHFRIPFYE